MKQKKEEAYVRCAIYYGDNEWDKKKQTKFTCEGDLLEKKKNTGSGGGGGGTMKAIAISDDLESDKTSKITDKL